MLERKLAAIIGFAVAAVVLASCSADGGTSGTAIVKDPDGKGKTLTLWHYEDLESAMGHAWTAAIAEFEKTTGATVKFEAKSYEGIRSTASQVLNSSSAPDVLEYTKGNGTAGLLSSQGLLTDLDAAAKLYGWDKQLSPSLQTTARYNDKGIMGTGPFYGIPNYGEFTEVYYNKDMFDRYGLSVPTTIADFENVLKTFKDAGITPLAESATEYPLGQLWYQLALSKANRQWVTNFQTFAEPADFHDPAFTYATQTIKDWVDKGYISKNSTGMKADDAYNGFTSGKYPIFYTGTWYYGQFKSTIKSFQWSDFLFPESTLAPGSAGNMWIVPANSKNKDLAYKFIDITMSPEIQTIIGNTGGIPVAADPSVITDPKSKSLVTNFKTLADRDGLAFYPDWPTPSFYDQLNAGLQDLVNGTKTPGAVLDQLSSQYQAGKSGQ